MIAKEIVFLSHFQSSNSNHLLVPSWLDWKNNSASPKQQKKRINLHLSLDSTLQSRTGKYRVLKGNPCNENRIPSMRTGFPVMKTGFFLWELTYREFPVSLTGGGFICTFSLLSSLSFTFQSSKFNYSSSSQWQLSSDISSDVSSLYLKRDRTRRCLSF